MLSKWATLPYVTAGWYVYKYIGKYYRELLEFKKARLALEQAIYLKPQRIGLYLELSLLLYKMEAYEEVVECCDNGLLEILKRDLAVLSILLPVYSYSSHYYFFAKSIIIMIIMIIIEKISPYAYYKLSGKKNHQSMLVADRNRKSIAVEIIIMILLTLSPYIKDFFCFFISWHSVASLLKYI